MTKIELLEEIEALIKLQEKAIDEIEQGHKVRYSKDHYLGRIDILKEMRISAGLLGRKTFGHGPDDQEYRWEFVETSHLHPDPGDWELVGRIGKGHYYFDFSECYQEAILESRKKPDSTIKIEIFMPEREVIGFLKNGQFLTPDKMSTIIKRER